MPKKKPVPYKLGRVEGEVDYSNKQSVREYHINRNLYWAWKFLALVLSTFAINPLKKLLGD